MTFTFPRDPLDYIRGSERDRAVGSLTRYFDGFTGAHFERLADDANPDCITADDLVAVTMLGVNVPAHTSPLGPG